MPVAPTMAISGSTIGRVEIRWNMPVSMDMAWQAGREDVEGSAKKKKKKGMTLTSR